uniref:Uncharacterized protein n=1 Tax=Anguilla anguilla TaxID=7936 RepID=A0A0E9RIS9_ANGAN
MYNAEKNDKWKRESLSSACCLVRLKSGRCLLAECYLGITLHCVTYTVYICVCLFI